jgi:hypothetical protein
MSQHFLEYFCCPETYAQFEIGGALSAHPGFFRWGRDTLCYGRTRDGHGASRTDAALCDMQNELDLCRSLSRLPFDPEEVVENLQRERYCAESREKGRLDSLLLRRVYYFLRPYLLLPIRKRLQRVYLGRWEKIPFPHWPVDCTVDRIHRKRFALAMREHGVDTVPFIWFWPDNYTSCAILTHDVEAKAGKMFCSSLMDLDESYGFNSSFQIIPEARYSVPSTYLQLITNRGFEVNVHDLTHDGRLYVDHGEFLRRAKRINEYARQFGAMGFRSGALYRNADWYDAFEFVYDMSIPDVAHLDPQRGGCCTVMPYFIGNMIELPLTCMQDYTIFHILRDYSIELWKWQIQTITSHCGLVSILVHPDYIIEPRGRKVYRDLLQYLGEVRDKNHMWTPLPRDVAIWWRQRRQMQLVWDKGKWRVEGPGSERARIAYACADDNDVTYRLEGESVLAER